MNSYYTLLFILIASTLRSPLVAQQLPDYLYFEISAINLKSDRNFVGENKSFDVDKYVESSIISYNVVVFKIKIDEQDAKVVQEIVDSSSEIMKKAEIHAAKFPGLTLNQEIPDGGVAGVLCVKTKDGELIELCKVTRKGNPLTAFSIINLNGDLKTNFDRLMAKFILSPDVSFAR